MSFYNVGSSNKTPNTIQVEQVSAGSSSPTSALPPMGVEGGIASAHLFAALKKFRTCCNRAGVDADRLTQQQRQHVVAAMWEWLDRNPAAGEEEAVGQLNLELQAFARHPSA